MDEGASSSAASSSSENEEELLPEQVEKLVQLQDITGIEDLSICRALLESKNWDLEATAREQFDARDPPPPPPPLRPHDEAPEIRQRLFGAEDAPVRRQRPVAAAAVGNGGPMGIMRWGFYWITLPVFWPIRMFYNVFSGAFWRLATIAGFVDDRQITHRPSGPAGAPLQDVRQFTSTFRQQYPTSSLSFFDGTYSQALEGSKKELKFLVAYIHCADHQDTHKFCRDVLCSDTFAAFMADKVMFGVAVETHEGHRVSQAIRVTSYPVLAVIVLRQNRMMIVGRQEGYRDSDSLVERFNAIVADNEAFIVAARTDRAERTMAQVLRQEQDEAFRESLRQDQEKERKRKEVLEAKRKEEEAIENARKSAEDRRNKIRQAKIDLAGHVPREPDQTDPESVRIVIKLPEGQRLERRFLKTQSIDALFYFVFCHPESPDDFDITTNFPRKVLPCRPNNFFQDIGISQEQVSDQNSDGIQTFVEAGIGQSTMLFVHDLEA